MEPLAQLAIIWTGVLVAVYLARRTRLTPVLYYLAVGAILVNTGLLPVEPNEFIRAFAEVGILLIMFAIGFDERVDHFLASVRRSWGIALFGALGPFVAVYAVTWWFWHDFAVSLMSALAMTATAVSLTMVALRAENLHGTPVATRIMTSAVLDHVGSLALVAVLIPIALGGQVPGVLELGVILLKVACFFAIVVVLSVWIFPHQRTGGLFELDLFRYFNLRTLLAFEDGRYATLILLLLALVVGLLAHAFGFHPAVGAYMAGLVVREEYFEYGESAERDAGEVGGPVTKRSTHAEVQRIVDGVAFAWFGPVFFVLLGTRLIFDWSLLLSLIPQVVMLTLALAAAQLTSAYVAARFTSGMGHAGSMLIGLGMLGRAELTFVVLDIAYVQTALMSRAAFYTLMITAFWLNVAVPLTLRWWKPTYLAEREQQAKLAVS